MKDTTELLQTTEEKLLSYADEIRKIRKSKHISQSQLATMSNVSFGSIKRFEQTGEISFNSLIKICNVLRINIELFNLNPTLKNKGFYNAK